MVPSLSQLTMSQGAVEQALLLLLPLPLLLLRRRWMLFRRRWRLLAARQCMRRHLAARLQLARHVRKPRERQNERQCMHFERPVGGRRRRDRRTTAAAERAFEALCRAHDARRVIRSEEAAEGAVDTRRIGGVRQLDERTCGYACLRLDGLGDVLGPGIPRPVARGHDAVGKGASLAQPDHVGVGFEGAVAPAAVELEVCEECAARAHIDALEVQNGEPDLDGGALGRLGANVRGRAEHALDDLHLALAQVLVEVLPELRRAAGHVLRSGERLPVWGSVHRLWRGPYAARWWGVRQAASGVRGLLRRAR